jgi:uncharacterized protein YndB with AHSA1/START domain
MACRFESTVVIDRPIEEVFAFLADGETDPKFSPPVLEHQDDRGTAGNRDGLHQHGQGRRREGQAGVQAHGVRTAHTDSLD